MLLVAEEHLNDTGAFTVTAFMLSEVVVLIWGRFHTDSAPKQHHSEVVRFFRRET